MTQLVSRLKRMMLGALAVSGIAVAQGKLDVSKGSIEVEVQDASGGVVPSASASLSGPEGTKVALTDVRGLAVFYGLTAGDYSVVVEAKGFTMYKAEAMHVLASERTSLIVALKPGIVTETIKVTEAATTVDITSTTLGVTMTESQYRNMPIERSPSSLFALAPGAAPGLGTDKLETPRQSFNPSISGASGLENLYVVDGINVTDQGFGHLGTTGLNLDFVKEVQVKTAGFEAQYGQALGGVVNMVTESGSNNFHGAVYAYSAPAWAEGEYKQPNAAGRTSEPITEMLGRHSFDAGFNLGGPLIKNKVFWYGGFSPSFSNLSRLAPLNFQARALGPQEWKSRVYDWIGKVDFNITPHHRVEGTALGDPSRDPLSVQSLLRDDLESAYRSRYGTRNWAVKYNGLITPSTLISASFAWSHSYVSATPLKDVYSVLDYTKPKSNAAYTLTGGATFRNTESDNHQYDLMLTKNSNILGSHQIDLGYSFNDISYDSSLECSGERFPLPAQKGVAAEDVGKLVNCALFILYPTLSIKDIEYRNVYQLARGVFSDPRISTASHYQDAFVQDAWRLNRFLTLKLGVRWEQQQIHGEVTRYVFAGNWAPRLGFIIDPTGSRTTKVFASWGRFFEKIPQDLAARSMSTESSYGNLYSFTLPPAAGNLVPNAVASPVAVEPTIIYGGTKAQYQEEFVAGLERELGHGLVVTASFTHRELKRVLEDISGITVEQALAGSGQQYVVSNPNVHLDIFHNATPCTSGSNCDLGSGYTLDSGSLGSDGKTDGFPDARRVYNAFQLSAEKRFGNSWSLIANYRLAKLFGNYEGLFRNDNNQSDPNITSLFDFANSPALADQFRVGVLPTDRRHILNLFGSYAFKRGLTFGIGFQSLSGTPLTKLLAPPAYINAGEVPDGPRGAYGRTAWQNYLDVHADYRLPIHTERYRVKLGCDVFNVFNRRTAVTLDQKFELDGAVPNLDFLKPTYYHRPVYGRFSVRLEF